MVKLTVALSAFAFISCSDGFSSPSRSSVMSKSQLYMSATEAVPFKQGEKIIRDELPILYVYDHCPFCVRVRLALGVKNIKHTVNFLANDDIPTPTKLIGKKIAPIFAIPEDDFIMGESLDIIEKVDSEERFGSTGQILPATGRKDLKEWQKKFAVSFA